jgi:predicted nucleotidyltransferase
MWTDTLHFSLARRVSEQFKAVAEVEAFALGGSQISGSIDNHSDIDLYVYSNEIVPLSTRRSIVEQLGAIKADLNLTFWDLGDEWIDLETGIEVDIIYWNQAWIEEQIEYTLINHQGKMGYSTCFWYTVLNSKILFERSDWFSTLQKRCRVSYPEELKHSIIAKNHPVLRSVIPSYYSQIQKSIDRYDLISTNHRLASLFSSFFDVLFAINEVLNPGEKKVLNYALAKCQKIPTNLEGNIESIMQSGATGNALLLDQIDELLDGLDRLLDEEGIDPRRTILLDKG